MQSRVVTLATNGRAFRSLVQPREQFLGRTTASIATASLSPGLRIACVALMLFAFCRWLLPVASPLWLDETASWWSIKEGFWAIPQRCTQHPVSVVYMQMLWLFREIFGRGEWGLRVSSVLLMAGSAWILFRIANRLFSSKVAYAAVVLFMALPNVAFGACDVRPYGLATFLTVLSTLLLIRWCGQGSILRAALYGAAIGFLFNVHYLFMLIALAHAVYLAAAIRHGISPGFKQLGAAGIAAAAAASPSIAAFLRLAGARNHFTFSRAPAAGDLFRGLFPPAFWIAVLAAVLIIAIGRRGLPNIARKDGILLVLSWGIIPAIALFAVSVWSGNTVFQPRYLLVAAPGVALIYALLFTTIRSDVLIVGLLAVVLATSTGQASLRGSLFRHTAPDLGNWRAALAFVDAQYAGDRCPVLIRSQYIESDYLDWNSRPVLENAQFTQLSYYPSRAELVPLPVGFDAAAPQLRSFAAGVFQSHKRFLLVSVDGPRSLSPFLKWFGERWAGVTVRMLRNFDGALVYEIAEPAR